MSFKPNAITDCTQQKSDRCAVPLFVEEMDDSLFSKIEGVLDLKIEGTEGYLIHFKIDGRPKYCFTLEEKPLSEEV